MSAAVETRDATRLRQVLLTPRRIEVWTTPGHAGAAAARVLYRARRGRARIASAAASRGLPLRARRTFQASLVQTIVADIAATIGTRASAVAALHARESERWLFALTTADGSGVVVKLGMLDDEGLAREAATMLELAATDATLRMPNLRWHGELRGWFAIVTDIAKRRSETAESNLEDARTAACALANAKRGFVVHGDLAPWNIVPTATGLVLVDWEDSRFADDPLYDLAHYVTRAGALLRAWRPETAVEHLTGHGSVGWRYMEDIGHDPISAPDHVLRYLHRAESQAPSPAVRLYQAAIADALESRSVRGR